MIDEEVLYRITDLKSDKKFKCLNIGMSSTGLPESLTFLDNQFFIDEILNNDNIHAVITTAKLAKKINKKKLCILSEDPRYSFYQLYNHFSKQQDIKEITKIHEYAKLSTDCLISEHNVKIGFGTVIESGVIIKSGVHIGDNCLIRSGAVLGAEGFEYKRTSKGILSVHHGGKLILENKVEVGANSVIEKGFLNRDTYIAHSTKIGTMVCIGHACYIDSNCLIASKSSIGGSCLIGKDCWVGINSTISNGIKIGTGANIALGSVVTSNVNAGEAVAGNFAYKKSKFLKNYMRSKLL